MKGNAQMNGRTLFWSVGTVVAAIFLAQAAASAFDGAGAGTPTDPYRISTVQQLQEMQNDLGAHYVLVNDIDASRTSSWNAGKGFSPVGDRSRPFTGVFDGQGHTIDALRINRFGRVTRYIGLFGYTGAGARIQNVRLRKAYVKGCDLVGVLVGLNRGTVSRCHASGSVFGSGTFGGLLGSNVKGTVSRCSAAVDVGPVWVGNHLGGLAGSNVGGTIVDCYATGTVKGRENPGGLVGVNTGGFIRNCYASGDVSSNFSGASNSYRRAAGGLVAVHRGGGKISDCFSTGKVTGPRRLPAGRLVGSSDSGACLHNSYCLVAARNCVPEIGKVYPESGPVECKSTDKIGPAFFIGQDAPLRGWDFKKTWGIEDSGTAVAPPFLKFPFGANYKPKFKTRPAPSPGRKKGPPAFSGAGAGTAKDPYRITNVRQLQEMRNHRSNAHFILMNDIDARATRRWNWDGKKHLGFEPVGMDYDGDGTIGPHEPFTGGSLNGNGHVIEGLYINRPDQDWVGLFGFTAHACIYKIGLERPDVTGHDHVGTLSGHVTDQSRYRTVVHQAYSAGGTVQGNFRVGGLLGRLHDAAMSDCYSTVKVTGNKTVGGLVGRVGFSDIRRCYASGAVTGSIGVGGLLGMSHATTFRKISVHDSFATGSVGSPTDDERPLANGFGGLIGYCTYDSAWGSPAASYNCTNNYYHKHAETPSVGVGNYPAIGSDIGRAVTSGGWTAVSDNDAYFRSSKNPPMTRWDFSTPVWHVHQGDPPVIGLLKRRGVKKSRMSAASCPVKSSKR